MGMGQENLLKVMKWKPTENGEGGLEVRRASQRYKHRVQEDLQTEGV